MLLERGRSSNIQALVSIVIIVVVATIIAIVLMTVEFCGGSSLRPLSEDLFTHGVYAWIRHKVVDCCFRILCW